MSLDWAEEPSKMKKTKRWNPQRITKINPSYLVARNQAIRENGVCMACKFFPLRCRGDSRLEPGSICSLAVEKTKKIKLAAWKKRSRKAQKQRAKERRAEERVALKDHAKAKAMATLERRWAREKQEAAILAAWNAGEPVATSDRLTLRALLRAEGSPLPTGEELANYPHFTRPEDRSEIEAVMERATHRPFGRRAVYQYLVPDYARGYNKYYREKGHYGDLIRFLQAALDGDRGKRVQIAWTIRMSAAWCEVLRVVKYEALSDEERAEVDRKRAEEKASNERVKLEVMKLLAGVY
jgi:hypothetical protein